MTSRTIRSIVIAAILVMGAVWSLSAAAKAAEGQYPNGSYLASGRWLKQHLDDPNLVVVDVRGDKDFDGRVIPGAVRMPYSLFRVDDPSRGIGDLFAGTVPAQEILGRHGVSRIHTVVLYDSVKRDGGATASYVFWVLDLLGHRDMMILDRGIDGWQDAGGEIASQARVPEPVLYQAPTDEIVRRRSADADFIYTRLGDPHYQVLDVRSREEYLGERANQALGGGALKLGHIPTAVNVEYKLNWTDKETKAVKGYRDLQELYRGLDPGASIILYCHSGRRGSYSYFILRLMGFDNVALYDPSWYEWGSEDNFYPVELTERKLAGTGLPTAMRGASAPGTVRTGTGPRKSPSGYVSCGG